jgi:hypothetical protein
MGNWRTVTIVGTIDPADVPAARDFVDIGRDNWDRFHCLCYTGPSLCGLGRWIPVAPPPDGSVVAIEAFGNLSERDYGVDDVAEVLGRLVNVAPSLTLKVHCGGEWESTTCSATVTVQDGVVSVGDPEVKAVGAGLHERGELRLLAILWGGGN